MYKNKLSKNLYQLKKKIIFLTDSAQKLNLLKLVKLNDS